MKNKSKSEKLEIGKLFLHKSLLETNPDEWLNNPNVFVEVCFPKNIIEIINRIETNSKDSFMNSLVADLIVQGISNIAKCEYPGGIEDLQSKLDLAMCDTGKVQ